MEILKCSGIEKVYGEKDNQVSALNGVDLSIEQGEFVVITGSSGSGKSTLLHILGSVEKPTKGTVTIDGQNVEGLNTTDSAIFRRRKVGIVYQFYNLIPTLTVEKNILMPVLLDKEKADENYLSEITALLGISDKLQALPYQLSGGQQQRVAIARALIHHPAVILADEPTGNLDSKNSDEIVALLKQSNLDFGQTVLLVTHNEQIASQAPRVIIMEDGRITNDSRQG